MRLLIEEKRLGYTPGGMILLEVTIRQPFLFYTGPIPLVYRTGALQMSSSRIVRWIELDDLRIEFGIKGKRQIPGVGASIPATAVASREGRVVARAEVVELIKGSGFFVEEQQLDEAGGVVYAAKSFFNFDGEKQNETEARGKKAKDYFFLWPTGR